MCTKTASISNNELEALEIAMIGPLKKRIQQNGDYNIAVSDLIPDLCDWIPSYLIIKNNYDLINILFTFVGEEILNNTCNMDRSLSYLCSKFKRIDLLELFLISGDNPDQQQSTGSTALHVASYYGHAEVVELLLKYGSDHQIKNSLNHTPIEEATSLVEEMYLKHIHPITQFVLELRRSLKNEIGPKRSRFVKTQLLKENSQFIGWYIENPYFTGIEDYNYSMECYHGTKLKFVSSILQNGLKVPGEKTKDGLTIEIQKGHIAGDVVVSGIFNFANAIFVSPSPYYSSSSIYSEQIQTPDNKQYCILLLIYAMENSYQIHQATALTRDGESYEEIEWRIPKSDFVMVQGVYFIDTNVIKKSATVQDIKSIFGQEKQELRKLSSEQIIQKMKLKSQSQLQEDYVKIRYIQSKQT